MSPIPARDIKDNGINKTNTVVKLKIIASAI